MKIKGTICGYKNKGSSGYPELIICISNAEDLMVPLSKRVVVIDDEE